MMVLSELKKKIRGFLKKKLYPVQKDWKKIHCVNERLTLRDHYSKKLPLIRELMKNQDVTRLKKELALYHEQVWQYYQTCKITIKFDEEIFSIYRQIYLTDIPKSEVKAFLRHIPRVWR